MGSTLTLVMFYIWQQILYTFLGKYNLDVTNFVTIAEKYEFWTRLIVWFDC